jgi:hypothetical protein
MVERSGWNSPFESSKRINKCDERNTALAPRSIETKALTTKIGCINFNQRTTAALVWIHVYDAAVAALGENYADF